VSLAITGKFMGAALSLPNMTCAHGPGMMSANWKIGNL